MLTYCYVGVGCRQGCCRHSHQLGSEVRLQPYLTSLPTLNSECRKMPGSMTRLSGKHLATTIQEAQRETAERLHSHINHAATHPVETTLFHCAYVYSIAL